MITFLNSRGGKKEKNSKTFQSGEKSHMKELESETSSLPQEHWKPEYNRSVSSN